MQLISLTFICWNYQQVLVSRLSTRQFNIHTKVNSIMWRAECKKGLCAFLGQNLKYSQFEQKWNKSSNFCSLNNNLFVGGLISPQKCFFLPRQIWPKNTHRPLLHSVFQIKLKSDLVWKSWYIFHLVKQTQKRNLLWLRVPPKSPLLSLGGEDSTHPPPLTLT